MTQLLDDPRTLSAARPDATRRARFGGVTVIVPCFNEEGIIADTVRQLTTLLEDMNRPYELIVVDDGSTDGSPRELRTCARTANARVLRNPRNRGYGYSLKRAIAEARYEIIAITDADGTYPNARLRELIELVDGTDMVVGARIGLNVNTPALRRPAKWFLRKLAGYLAETDIPDLNSGLRVMKRTLVRRFMHLLPDGFSFTTTITLALLTHGYDVRYVPIDYYKRVGMSSIRPLRDTVGFLSLIVRTVMYFKPLKVFGPATGILLLTAIVWGVASTLLLGSFATLSVLVIALASMQLLAIGLLADLIDKRWPSPAA